MRVREPRKNKPNFNPPTPEPLSRLQKMQNKPNSLIQDRTLSQLVASTPAIKPVSACQKVTKNAKKALILRCFGDVSTRFGLFLPRFRAFRTAICAFLQIFF